MNLRTHLFAAALLFVPVSATAQAADCGIDLNVVADQLKAMNMTTASVTQTGGRSGWTITWNRMATALQTTYAATLPSADRAPSGAEDIPPQGAATKAQVVGASDPANILARAQSSWQAARAANARGDEAGCQRGLADARQLLDSIKG